MSALLQANPKARYQGLRATVRDTLVLKYGVLADGDFSQATGKDGKAPTTGSIGFNLLTLVPVLYEKAYDYSVSKNNDALRKTANERRADAEQARLKVAGLREKAAAAERQAGELENGAGQNNADKVRQEQAQREAQKSRAVADTAVQLFQKAAADAATAEQVASAAQKAATDDVNTQYFTVDEVLEPAFALSAVISFGPRQDTLRVRPDTLNPGGRCLNQHDFGQSLLLPGSAANSSWRSASASARWMPAYWWVKHSWFRNFGLGGDLGIATTRWAANNRTSDINLVSGSAGLYYTLANTLAHDADDFALRLDAFGRYTFRQLSGDIKEEGDIVTRALGTANQYFFDGYELGAQASLNALRVTVTWSSFGGHIKGFSNGQVVFGIGFSNAFRFNKSEKLTGGIVRGK